MKLVYGQEKRRIQNKKSQGKIKMGVALFLLFAIGGLFYIFRSQITSFFDPVSIVASVGASNLKTTNGRTNTVI